DSPSPVANTLLPRRAHYHQLSHHVLVHRVGRRLDPRRPAPAPAADSFVRRRLQGCAAAEHAARGRGERQAVVRQPHRPHAAGPAGVQADDARRDSHRGRGAQAGHGRRAQLDLCRLRLRAGHDAPADAERDGRRAAALPARGGRGARPGDASRGGRRAQRPGHRSRLRRHVSVCRQAVRGRRHPGRLRGVLHLRATLDGEPAGGGDAPALRRPARRGGEAPRLRHRLLLRRRVPRDWRVAARGEGARASAGGEGGAERRLQQAARRVQPARVLAGPAHLHATHVRVAVSE
ncbi:hypothetical protein EMIHUDRAFT_431801, partial [Emiliania huxleyi CCMP1516]|uniref:Uncharacterized protein n=2 Tax=Emiliania huxleyi TaxID=2903 RepID=A0A0D3L191_EMIH1